jgi:hypothetical protein
MNSLKKCLRVTVEPLLLAGTLILTLHHSGPVEAADKDVVVVNPTTNPALVRDVDAAAQPYDRAEGAVMAPGEFFVDLPFPAVPLGKRLIIEYASASCVLPVGQAIEVTVTSTGTVNHSLTLSPVSLGRTSIGQAVRIYVPASDIPIVVLQRRPDAAGNAACNTTLSGRLVNLP